MKIDANWDYILNTIRDEKCVLLLGPEVYVTKEGKHYDEALVEYLNVAENKDIKTYYEHDGLFLFTDEGGAKSECYYKIKDFHKLGHKEEIYHKIAEIPFHLIISINPDHNLDDAFESKNLSRKFEYYDKTQTKDVLEPSKNSPLIYNLFGSVNKVESMILTHNDLFVFLFKILGGQKLPQKLKNALLEAYSFIFLGFKFEKWYVQLLLRLLYLHNEKLESRKFALNNIINLDTEKLVGNQFQIKFVENHIEEFVNELHKQCSDKGMLRDPEADNVTTYELVNKYIEEDELDKAFDKLKEYIEKKNDEDSLAELITLKGRYRRHQKKVREGILTESEATTGRNKIRVALKEFNDDIKSLE